MGRVEDADRDLKELLDELSAEISFIAKNLPGELGIAEQYADPSTLSQVERRLLVRSVFSFIEALVFNLKMGSLVSDTNKLSPAEIALIKEEEYDLDESGVIRTRKARLRFFANFRFAFAVAAKAAEVNYHLDVSGDGWLALRTALSGSRSNNAPQESN